MSAAISPSAPTDPPWPAVFLSTHDADAAPGRSTELVVAQAAPLDGYCAISARLLRLGAPTLEATASEFVESFYATLATEAEPERILSTLSASDMEHLKLRQAEHLQWLMQPELTREALLGRALTVGFVHALSGLLPSLLVGSTSSYLQLLAERVIAMPGALADRTALLQVLNIRLRDELRAQIDAVGELQGRYQAWLRDCIDAIESAPSEQAYVAQCLDRLVQLPGMAAAAWGLPRAYGAGTIFHACGQFEAYAAALEAAGLPRPAAAASQFGGGSTTAGRAWVSCGVVVNLSYISDRDHGLWREAAASVGIRASAALPVLQDGEAVSVVSVYGRFPAQFEAAFMRDLLESFLRVLKFARRRLHVAAPR
jgi:hypothetical protein